MVATSVLMNIIFVVIFLILGKDYLVEQEFLAAYKNFFFYILTNCLNFSVYLTILQLGVRTFVTELTQSFQGISSRLLPGAVPGIDCAGVFGFGSPNAVTVGFLFGALGQFLAIIILIVMKSPTLVIAGFVPVFFDNATIAVYANNKGGFKAAMLMPFICGLIQIFGSAAIASWVGLAEYGGYMGMFDWATIRPIFTVIMKFLGYFGIVIVVLILVFLPPFPSRNNPDPSFLLTAASSAYLEKITNKQYKFTSTNIYKLSIF